MADTFPNQNFFSTKIIGAVLAIILVYSIIFYISFATTNFPAYEKIPAMDGNQYLKIYDYFNSNNATEYKIDFPYNNRILSFWIAGLFPDTLNPFLIFTILNYCFGLATLLLLFIIWEKLSLPFYFSFFLIVYLCIHWSGMIRQYD